MAAIGLHSEAKMRKQGIRKMPMTLRISAAYFDLQVETEKGKATFDLSKLNQNQLQGARELIVNQWCREHNMQELYHG